MSADGRNGSVRLQKYLSRAGVASRREGERLIQAGRVSIDGTVVTELGTKVELGKGVVCVDGERVDPEPVRWIALYKPAGYLTARKDDRGRPTVYSVLPRNARSLFHVGRLDRLSEGLLILTNDGETAHRLLHPRYEMPRRYRVEVGSMGGAGDVIGDAVIERLEAGVALEDGRARAEDVHVELVGRGRPVVQLTLREGRKREVRRMMEALGLSVRRLVRIAFGPIELEGLAPGEWRELRAEEIAALERVARLGGAPGD